MSDPAVCGTLLSQLSISHIRYILCFLEDFELWDISFTCRRLHEQALSLLLSRRGIPHPLEKVELHLGEEDGSALQVLRVALFLPSVKHLSVEFSSESTGVGIVEWALTVGQLQSTSNRLLGELDRLRRVLEKLQTVGDITLILPGSLEWNLRDVNLERGDTSDLFSWLPLISLLHETLQTHCTSLAVTTSPFLPGARAVSRPTAAKGRLVPHLVRKVLKRSRETDMSALARREGIKYRPHRLPAAVVLRPRSRLTHFTIQTTLLLFPGIAAWTFSIIKHSPITSIRLSDLSISQSDWGAVASKFVDAAPNLLELDFDDAEIEPDCLMWILNRLKRLTSLKIGRHMSVYLTYPRIFPHFSSWYLPAFRNLSTLSAPTSYVSLFLMRPNPLPALTSLEIPPTDIWQIATRQHISLYVHLPKIIRRLRDIKHVVYPLPVTLASGWNGRETSFLLSRQTDASLALDPKEREALREITHLVFEDFNSSLQSPCDCLYHWLKLFPALEQVSWRETEECDPTVAINILRLAREISRVCPTVKSLVVHGTHYRVETVLSLGHPDETGSLLVNLPTEVLLSIFEFLDAELFSLSLLCRRLHFLALPLFLERHSIPDPCERTFLQIDTYCPSDDDVLRALTIALFIPSIKHLICVFPDPVSIHRHLASMRRVTRLLMRLEKVDKLWLEFNHNHFRLDNFAPKTYTESRIWGLCYHALWDLLGIGNTRSTSLRIVGCPAPVGSAYSDSSTAILGADSIVDLHVDVDVDQPSSYPSWLFSALKRSPISSLTLKLAVNTNLAVVDFSATLTTLCLDGGYVPGWLFVDFIQRHPRLTTLTLAVSTDHYPGLTLRLDHLVVLTAPFAFLSHFLHTCESPFPILERLKIRVDDLADLGWALTALVERIHESYVTHPPTISVHLTPQLDLRSLSTTLAHFAFLEGKWTHAARHIAELAVECHWDWFGFELRDTRLAPGVVQALLDWFSSFPGLRRIYIESASVFIPPELVGLNALQVRLPNLEIVHVNKHVLFER
ncbi:hypothetical protein C8R46DRAFT_1295949 [Mycena filopes]|nr:hypothetical protein C8R46DRAFT_1295949 [Mycena filopes]